MPQPPIVVNQRLLGPFPTSIISHLPKHQFDYNSALMNSGKLEELLEIEKSYVVNTNYPTVDKNTPYFD